MKREFSILIAASTILLAVCGAVFAQGTSKDDAGIAQAEKAWAVAVAKQDMAALNRILADDLIYVHSTGIVESKAEYLEKMKTGAQKYDSIEHLELKTHSFGASGYAASKVRMRGATRSQPFDNTLRMMHLWVNQNGVWRLGAHQTARLPE